MSYEHLRRIRHYELERVLARMPPGSAVLEIGAGAGWQAKTLAERGYAVEAIDVEGSEYSDERAWPVRSYDGLRIPFRDGAFDVVFSSNALEHIPHVAELQQEIRRVLKGDGVAIHILPTATWRIATSLLHYPCLLKRLLRGRSADGSEPALLRRTAREPGTAELLKRPFIPPRHGEKGNVLTEVYWFSRFRWRALFRETGWRVRAVEPVRLFYSGGSLLDSLLDLRIRRALSYTLGSSCLIYVLEPAERAAPRSGWA